jgi:Fe-S oxidoreductase
MATLVDLRRASGAMRCLECGKCSTLCPLSSFRNFSVVRMAAIHERGDDLAAHAGLINRCLTCGSCEIRCPQGVHFATFVRGLREEMPASCRDRCPHGAALQSAARLTAQNAAVSRDLSWIGEGLRVAENGEVALFVGCLPLFDIMFEEELGIRTIEIARAAIRLLNAAGIEPVIVAQERCCGHDLLWNGERGAFRALAEANAAAFESRGVKHIVSACAECCRTWKIDYAEAVPGYKPKVEHISELAARQLQSGALKLQGDGAVRVTFQDPCRLARHLGVVDAPRQILSAVEGTQLIEMEHRGGDALCCGTAGFVHCDSDSRRMQELRLDEASGTGAEVLLTACPKCWIHFACASHEDDLRERGRPKMAIEDLTLFAARHIQRGVTP